VKRKRLGRTDQDISAVGLGTTGTGPRQNADSSRDAHRVRVLRAAVDAGMNFIDTAELYGGGHGEEIAGWAISGIRQSVFLASKFNPANSSARALEDALNSSLDRLRTDYLDLYQVHWTNPFIPLEETLDAMTALVSKGKVRYLGLCNASLGEIEIATKIAAISAVQVEYNLIERSVELDVLPFCEREGISVVAYGTQYQRRDLELLEPVRRLAEKYGQSTSQLLLNWATRRPSCVALTMTTNLEHVTEIATATDFDLAPEDAIALETATRCETIWVMPRDIEIIADGGPLHLTLESARRNPNDLIPHPIQLSENIRRYNIQKPIKLGRNPNRSLGATYVLLGEHLRYWAWILAYGWDRAIPAYLIRSAAHGEARHQ